MYPYSLKTETTTETVVDPTVEVVQELEAAYEKIERLTNFIEMTEAFTYDPKTSQRIRDFLIKEGIWKP